MECIGDDVIVDLLDGRLGERELDAVTSHLDACDACRALVADAARGFGGDDAPLLARGTNIGRYVVLAPVGSGSMGTVYAAYDPELDRKVALKLLRNDAFAPGDGARLGLRLLREAQALAKLSHPNVVAVYDVGRVGDETFIAMEFVEGSTLRAWLHTQKRSAREVLRVLRLAGEGLAAAHAAGIIHRDFKPENVLIGEDSRVRVSDFGLARALSFDDDEKQPGAPTKVRPLHASRTGALVGTPAYMAMEQWAGGTVDERTDVFGFGVALFEALYGVRPFEAETPEELARALERELPEPKTADVPAWLRRIVARALREKPADRWPSMRAMLDALDRGPKLTAQRLALVVLLPLLVATGAWAMTKKPVPPCAGADSAWGDVWNESQRAAVKAAFLRTGVAGADHAFEQLDGALSGFRKRWVDMRTDACLATRVRAEQSDALLDLRMACLDDRRREIAALTKQLASADAAMASSWPNALAGLSALEGCANARALTGVVPLPSDAAARGRIDALSTRLADAKAQYWSGHYREAAEAAAPLLEPAKKEAYSPLVARILLLEGDAEQRMQKYDESTRHLHAAAAAALGARDDIGAADAWSLLVRVEGYLEQKPEQGKIWAAYARGALARAGGDDEREATLIRNLATMERGAQGLFEADAVSAELRRARALYAKTPEPQRSLLVSDVDETLAALMYLTGKMEGALATYHDTEVVRTRVVGAEHPRVAAAIGNQGDCLLILGRYDEALAHWNRVAKIVAGSGAGETWMHIGRAQVLRGKHDFAAALADDDAALDIATRTAGEGSMSAAEALLGKGLDLLGLGRASEALPPLERALSIREHGATRVDMLAEVRFAVARALRATGGDAVRAVSLATSAKEGVQPFAKAFGSFYAAMVRDIDAWLAGT